MEPQQFREPGCEHEQPGIRQQHLDRLLDGCSPDHVQCEDSFLAPSTRRSFLKRAATSVAARFLLPHSVGSEIKQVILIVPGGARKKDYCENASLAPNIGALAADGF